MSGNDVDALNDPLLADYERARDLLRTPDWRRGLEELETLARRGSTMSILLVADAMRTGWMYDQDLPGAEAWYRAAAESGSARGLFGLGLTYVEMDRIGDAVGNLEAAIARGFPPAYNALANLYVRGYGVPHDRRLALKLWRKGASLGHLPAKRNRLQWSLRGHYGVPGALWAIVWFAPILIEMATVQVNDRFTDRLR